MFESLVLEPDQTHDLRYGRGSNQDYAGHLVWGRDETKRSHCQTDVDEQVTAASCDERCGCRREDDRDL